MWLKRYRAKTVAEAMRQVKRELGHEAIVLETRKVYTGGILGFLFRRQVVELTAALDAGASPAERRQRTLERAQAAVAQAQEAQVLPTPLPVRVVQTADPTQPEPPVAEAVQALRGLEDPVTRPADEGQVLEIPFEVLRALREREEQGLPFFPEPWNGWYERLKLWDVDETLARALLVPLVDEEGERAHELLRRQLRRAVGASPRQNGGQFRRVVALVGPTGAGKTTTVAKLAAHASLEEGRKVALIAADTFRMGAVDQLESYAELVDLPLAVAGTSEEMEEALLRFARMDLVLIDTTGSNPLDAERMNQLQKLLGAARPAETHLVLSIGTRYRDAVRLVERFRPLSYNRLLLTNLDETDAWGLAFNLRSLLRLPVSYVTTGQQVPSDIQTSPAEYIVGRLVGGA